MYFERALIENRNRFKSLSIRASGIIPLIYYFQWDKNPGICGSYASSLCGSHGLSLTTTRMQETLIVRKTLWKNRVIWRQSVTLLEHVAITRCQSTVRCDGAGMLYKNISGVNRSVSCDWLNNPGKKNVGWRLCAELKYEHHREYS